MTVEQLKAHLEASDLDFFYNGKHYAIMPVNVFAPFIACEKDQDARQYETFDELLNDFTVEGKPLKDILPDIDW